MKTVLAILALAIAATSTLAEERLALIQPPGSKLVVTKVERKEGLSAEFRGQIRVTGTLVAQWLRGVDEETDNTLEIRLLPDERSIKALPFFDRYPVRKIDLENEKEALSMAVGPKLLTQLERRQLKLVKAEGSFLIERYVVGVECDASWARATVVKVNIPKPLSLVGTPQPFGC